MRIQVEINDTVVEELSNRFPKTMKKYKSFQIEEALTFALKNGFRTEVCDGD